MFKCSLYSQLINTLVFFFIASGAASQPDYYGDAPLDFSDKIFDKDIHTIQLFPEGAEMQWPLIFLDKSTSLELHFDDLSDEVRDFYYTVEHCNRNWESSGLIQSDYIEGFYSDQIMDYAYSFNTLVPYTHYSLKFPNDQIRLRRSGNYILKVYINGDEDDLAFTKRFYVAESVVHISPKVKVPSVVADREYRQEVDFEINLGNLNLPNAYGDLEAVLMQNRRYDNAKTGLKPVFVKGNQLIYDYDDKVTFDGGNEYRFFNIGSLRYRSEQVANIEQGPERIYHVLLNPIGKRNIANYSYYNDINGRYVIRNDDMTDPEVDADYVKVHFKLPLGSPLSNGQVYVFGDLSMNGFDEKFKMVYDENQRAYTAEILLKQGYYNYAYMFLPDGKIQGDFSKIEGSHFATENEYSILLYYQDISARSDRLLGYHTFKSLED